jgi:membrane protease YdiL (CAAX protease family)
VGRLKILILFLGCFALCGYVISGLSNRLSEDVLFFSGQLVLLVSAIVVLGFRKINREKNIVLLERVSPLIVTKLAVLFVLCLVTSICLSSLNTYIFESFEYGNQILVNDNANVENVAVMFPYGSFIHGLIAFAGLGLLPGLSEELCFRALLLEVLNYKKKPYAALVISALIFSLIHGQISNLVVIFFMGLCLAYVYLYTKNIFASVLFHASFNFVNWLVYNSDFSEYLDLWSQKKPVVIIVTIIILPALIYFLKKRLPIYL